MPRINRLKPLAVDKAKTPGRYATAAVCTWP